MNEITIHVPYTLPSYKCSACVREFAIINIVPGGEDKDFNEYGPTVFLWGNPDRPPRCPECGSKEHVSRGEEPPAAPNKQE